MTHILDDPKAHVLIDANGCWLWQRARYRTGYGAVGLPGTRRQVAAHRAVYEKLVGAIPEGLQLDHLCRVKHCVNPEHLEPVTASENRRRVPTTISHCPKGHPYGGDNLYLRLDRSGRACKTCKRDALRRYKAAAICEIEGCAYLRHGRGLCYTHYFKSRGLPTYGAGRKKH